MLPMPEVDVTRCIGSGTCVALCPAGCLEMGDGVPWLPRPLDCVSCAICAEVCPANAVQMKEDPLSGQP